MATITLEWVRATGTQRVHLAPTDQAITLCGYPAVYAVRIGETRPRCDVCLRIALNRRLRVPL